MIMVTYLLAPNEHLVIPHFSPNIVNGWIITIHIFIDPMDSYKLSFIFSLFRDTCNNYVVGVGGDYVSAIVVIRWSPKLSSLLSAILNDV